MRTSRNNKLSTRIATGALLLAGAATAGFVALVHATSHGHQGSELLLGATAFVGLLGLIILFAIDLMRSVVTPIRLLTQNARRLGSGDQSVRIPESGSLDIRELAASLNSVAISLEGAGKSLELQRSELATGRQETWSANHAKNEFLSRMSHELRTPLNAILGFAQLLEMDELDARQRDNVAHIVNGGKHLLDLINEVLEISRIETGTMTPVIEPINAAAAIDEAIEMVGPLALQRGIELKADMRPHQDTWIDADRQRLKQVLLNLLANAVKYNREGGSVTVEVRHVGERIRINVVDTGMGIPHDQLPKLFVPFERLGAEATGVEGTGLGLVLCLRLTEAMNGTLGVQSQPWIGSTFHIELPLAAEAGQKEPESHAPRLGPSTPRPGVDATRVHRVLYIEDDTANTELMSELFAEEPRLELFTTMQGKLGVELARRHVPDAILLDLHLPDIDGPEIIRRLRSDDLTRDIPVIAVSADATEETRARLTALGVQRYLTKPINLTATLTAIWDVLDAADQTPTPAVSAQR